MLVDLFCASVDAFLDTLPNLPTCEQPRDSLLLLGVIKEQQQPLSLIFYLLSFRKIPLCEPECPPDPVTPGNVSQGNCDSHGNYPLHVRWCSIHDPNQPGRYSTDRPRYHSEGFWGSICELGCLSRLPIRILGYHTISRVTLYTFTAVKPPPPLKTHVPVRRKRFQQHNTMTVFSDEWLSTQQDSPQGYM